MTRTILLLIFILVLFCKGYSQDNPVKFSGYTQGTTYSITYFDKYARDFKPEIEKILKDFDHSVSLWDSTSIISRINRGEENCLVDAYFKFCFEKAIEVSSSTDGAFDITVGPLVNAWGFGLKKKGKVDSAMIDSLKHFVGYQLVSLKNKKVIKKDPRIQIDLNALAQGYSVDLIADFLKSKKIKRFLVEIGGEVYANDPKPNGDLWKVGIEKPVVEEGSENELKAIALIKNIAINTSGNNHKFFIENGIRYSHEINPKTGYPARNTLLSATVFAKDCITADAYATAFMVMGLEKTKLFLEKHAELMAYLIYSDEKGNYQIYQSEKLKGMITSME